jgi:Secretion system C-terminal sorting domain
LCIATADQINPNICSDNNNGAIVAWQHGNGNQFDIKAQHIDSMGNTTWATNGSIVSDADSTQLGPKNIPDGNGGSVIVWEDLRNSNIDIYCNRINANGSLWPLAIAHINSNSDLQVWPNPATDNITITGANLDKLQNIVMVNAQGQVVKSFNVNIINNEKIIISNMAALLNGVYFIQLKSKGYTNTVRFYKN